MKKLMFVFDLISTICVISNLKTILFSTVTFTGYGFLLFAFAVSIMLITTEYLINEYIYE